jgi:hypothetical protein
MPAKYDIQIGRASSPGDATMVSTDGDYLVAPDVATVLIDARIGPRSVILPAPKAGRIVAVKKTDATANAVTVRGTVDGGLNHELADLGEYVVLIADGAGWWIIGCVTTEGVDTMITFADATARAATIPTYVGQFGLQLDTVILYRATATTAGSWVATSADMVGAEPANANIQSHVTGTGSPHTLAGVGGDVIGALATLTRSIVLTFDGGGSAITATPVYLRMPFAFTPTKWTIVAGASSSIAFSVCVDPYSTTTLPTTSVGGTAPSLTTAVAATAVPDWTDTTWADGELLKVVPTGTPTATWAVLVIEGTSVE